MAKRAKKAFNLAEYSKDVTINDFANSSIPKTGRVKKNEINNIISQVKNLKVGEEHESWNVKLEYLDDVNDTDEDESKTALKKKGKKKLKRNEVISHEDDTTQYNVYPPELWFKISEYITPADVGRFASICSDTLAVVSTAIFWQRLYRRYYKPVPDLPKFLQPECIVRKYGLRANVIRALYYMYPPFTKIVKSEKFYSHLPSLLIKRMCILSWAEKRKNFWSFFFKLKTPNFGKEDSENEKKPGLLEMLEDINANADEDCKMLEVRSLEYVPLPMISGQRLKDVHVTSSDDLKYYKMELSFGCANSPQKGNNHVTMDSVLKIRILDWWHPSFPFSNGLNCPSYSNESSYLMDEIDFN